MNPSLQELLKDIKSKRKPPFFYGYFYVIGGRGKKTGGLLGKNAKIKFGSIADVKEGINTRDNKYYIYSTSGERSYNIPDQSKILKQIGWYE